MRRNAPPAIVLAALAACGDASLHGPLTDVALDTGGDESSGPADSSDDDGSAGSSDDGSTGASTGDAAADAGETAATTAPPAVCGDGVVEGDEACDGPARPCEALGAGYTWGDAPCAADCAYDLAACQTCEAPALVPCDGQSDAVLHALELGCPDLAGWTAGNGVPLLARTFASADQDAYRVLRRFGSHDLDDDTPAWAPRAGERMLLLGTGKFGPLDIVDALLEVPGAASLGGSNANPEAPGGFELPAPVKIRMAKGSRSNTPFVDCDGVNDCSHTLNYQWQPASMAADIAYLDVTIAVPRGTRGYALDVALFTAHFPEYTHTTHNDMAIVWSQSEAYVGNIAHLVDGEKARPLSLPTMDEAGLMTHDGADDPALLGTGYDDLLGEHGAATDWLTLHGPAIPGERLTLALAVLDLDDENLDSALLVDNFRWRCEACTLGAPAEQAGCGLRPASR
ncbi:MAG: hypothetical protein JNL82_39450 [Myxococcales bacterium]|nr:hypothetical protein [Myxococcales bacterium]